MFKLFEIQKLLSKWNSASLSIYIHTKTLTVIYFFFFFKFGASVEARGDVCSTING